MKLLFIIVIALVAIGGSFTTAYGPCAAGGADTSLGNANFTHKELYDELIKRKVPYPEIFTKVAIYEAGWNLDSHLATNCNNFFGFVCIEGYLCESNGEQSYTCFVSREDGIDYLEAWIKMNPIKDTEDPYQYLKRRGYNSLNPEYYTYLETQIRFNP